MKSTRMVLAAVSLAAAAFASSALDVVDRFYGRVVSLFCTFKAAAAKWLGHLVTGALSLAGRLRAPVLRGVTLARFKAFRERQVRRQRPVVTQTWRMCSSV